MPAEIALRMVTAMTQVTLVRFTVQMNVHVPFQIALLRELLATDGAAEASSVFVYGGHVTSETRIRAENTIADTARHIGEEARSPNLQRYRQNSFQLRCELIEWLNLCAVYIKSIQEENNIYVLQQRVNTY